MWKGHLACRLSRLFMESYHQHLMPLNSQVIHLACDPASGKTSWHASYESGVDGLSDTNAWSQMEVIVLEKIEILSSSQKCRVHVYSERLNILWALSKQLFLSRIWQPNESVFTELVHGPQASVVS